MLSVMMRALDLQLRELRSRDDGVGLLCTRHEALCLFAAAMTSLSPIAAAPWEMETGKQSGSRLSKKSFDQNRAGATTGRVLLRSDAGSMSLRPLAPPSSLRAILRDGPTRRSLSRPRFLSASPRSTAAAHQKVLLQLHPLAHSKQPSFTAISPGNLKR
jgi:hypothetical protein